MSKKFKPYFKATIKKIKGTSSMLWDLGEEDKVKKWLGALQWKTVDTKKYKIVEIVSINDFNTKEMTDFINNVRHYSQRELGLYIPKPNEADYEDLPETLPEF